MKLVNKKTASTVLLTGLGVAVGMVFLVPVATWLKSKAGL